MNQEADLEDGLVHHADGAWEVGKKNCIGQEKEAKEKTKKEMRTSHLVHECDDRPQSHTDD